MKLGVIKRILKEDLARGGELPGWIDQLLTPLNEFIEKIGLSLQSRLTFTDNFLCKIVTQSFTSNVEYEINPYLDQLKKTRPVGVLFPDFGGAVVDQFGWRVKSNGNLGVTIKFATAASSNCTIYILLG